MITNELTWSHMIIRFQVWGYIYVTRHRFSIGYIRLGTRLKYIHMLREILPHTHTLVPPQIPSSWHQGDVSRLSPRGGRWRHHLEGTKEDRSHQEIPQGHLLGPPGLPHLRYPLSHNNFSTDVAQIKTHILITWCPHFRWRMVSSLYWWQCPDWPRCS